MTVAQDKAAATCPGLQQFVVPSAARRHGKCCTLRVQCEYPLKLCAASIPIALPPSVPRTVCTCCRTYCPSSSACHLRTKTGSDSEVPEQHMRIGSAFQTPASLAEFNAHAREVATKHDVQAVVVIVPKAAIAVPQVGEHEGRGVGWASGAMTRGGGRGVLARRAMCAGAGGYGKLRWLSS